MDPRTQVMSPRSRLPKGIELTVASSAAPLAVAQLLWCQRGATFVTIIVKVTVSLENGERARPIAPSPFPPTPDAQAADPAFAPHLPSTGITVVGHARAPAGTMIRQTTVRARILDASRERTILDKSLSVVGDRPSPDAFPDVFDEIPLIDDLAYGGPSVDENPRGIGAAPDAGSQPNILPLDRSRAFASLGPIPAARPLRRRLLGATPIGTIDSALWVIPDGLDWRYFHSASPDQQMPYLTGAEWIVLEGFEAKSPKLESRLPGLSPRALIRHAFAMPDELDLTLDYLDIDADKKAASIYWRGHREIDADDIAEHEAIVALGSQEAPIVWPADWARSSSSGSSVSSAPRSPVSEGRSGAPVGLRSTLHMTVDQALASSQAMPSWLTRAVDPTPTPEPPARPQSTRAPAPPPPAPPPSVPPPPGPVALPEIPAPPPGPPPISQTSPGTAVAPSPSPVLSPPPRQPVPPPLGPSLMGAPALATGPLPLPEPPMPSFMRGAKAALHRSADPPERPAAPLDVADSKAREPSPERASLPSIEASTPVASARASSAFGPPALARDSSERRAAVIAMIAKGESLEGIDLSRVDLHEMDFTGASLRRANLTGTRLTQARLGDADLSRAQLQGADLTGADLSGANLERADLRGALLSGADLRRTKLGDADFAEARATKANLRAASGIGTSFRAASFDDCDLSEIQIERADFGEASLEGSTFEGATLGRANFDAATLSRMSLDGAHAISSHWWGTRLEDCSMREASVPRSIFRGASFVRCKLAKVDLSDSSLREAVLEDVDLSSAQLRNTDWQLSRIHATRFRKVDLSGSSLRGATGADVDFDESKLDNVDLSHAKLEGASFVASRLRGLRADGAFLVAADFSRADLSGARLRGANVARADLAFAVVEGADLTDADLTGAWLFRVDQSKARLTGARLEGCDTKTDPRKRKAAE